MDLSSSYGVNRSLVVASPSNALLYQIVFFFFPSFFFFKPDVPNSFRLLINGFNGVPQAAWDHFNKQTLTDTLSPEMF